MPYAQGCSGFFTVNAHVMATSAAQSRVLAMMRENRENFDSIRRLVRLTNCVSRIHRVPVYTYKVCTFWFNLQSSK
eukprot:1031506-Rhodomonas_salina.2